VALAGVSGDVWGLGAELRLIGGVSVQLPITRRVLRLASRALGSLPVSEKPASAVTSCRGPAPAADMRSPTPCAARHPARIAEERRDKTPAAHAAAETLGVAKVPGQLETTRRTGVGWIRTRSNDARGSKQTTPAVGAPPEAKCNPTRHPHLTPHPTQAKTSAQGIGHRDRRAQTVPQQDVRWAYSSTAVPQAQQRSASPPRPRHGAQAHSPFLMCSARSSCCLSLAGSVILAFSAVS
jgi:hypothetical protein